MRRLSNRTTNKLRTRTSSSNIRSREQNAGPTVVRTRSGSRTLNDGAIDVSDLELDGVDEQLSQQGLLSPLPAPVAGSIMSPTRVVRIHRDPDGKPIVPPRLFQPIKFSKVTKRKKGQGIRLQLEQSMKKVTWYFEGQNSRKEILIDDMTEIRTGKLARAHVDELGYEPESEDSWVTIIYYDPATRGKGRSTHAIHVIANEPSTGRELRESLDALIQDRRELMAGISGRTDDDRSLGRLWGDMTGRKYSNSSYEREGQLLDREDMRRCCHNCLIYMSDEDFEVRFQAADGRRRGALNRLEFVHFFRSVHEREDLRAVFDRHKRPKLDVMFKDDFFYFLIESQGLKLDDEFSNCEALFKKYADVHHGLGIAMGDAADGLMQDAMTFDAFKRFFLDDNVPLPSAQSSPKFDRPLNEYFISSSHNTYLSGRQVGGHSSTEPYVDCLKSGCRCVEIDCWDGDDGEPWVTHGRTATKGISFVSIIKAIKLWAFRVSQYPLIISLEVHCSPTQQRKMADIMKKHFGKKLVLTLVASAHHSLPSPEELKGRILIKVKEPMQYPIAAAHFPSNAVNHRRTRSKSEADVSPSTPRQPRLTGAEARISPMLLTSPSLSVTLNAQHPRSGVTCTSTSSDETDSDEDDRRKKPKPPKTSKIVPELGYLGVYTRGVKFSGFKTAASKMPTHVYSFSEGTFHKKASLSQAQLEKHNRKHLMRVYPKASRIRSDNPDPLQFWRHGVQMVATNWQTYDLGTEINDAMFASGHDRLGYVLKPKEIRLAREDASEGVGEPMKKFVRFSVVILSARHLHPLPGTSTINPYLEVEIFSADNPAQGLATATGADDASAKPGTSGIGKPTRLRTNIKQGNGWNPVFNKQIEVGLETEYPSLVFVRFTAWNSPDGRKPSDQREPLAAHTAKLSSLRQGFRVLHLRDKHGDHTLSHLLIEVRKEDEQDAPSRKSSRDQSPESPRISEESGSTSRRIFRGLFSRTPSERRKGTGSEPSSGIISRTISSEK